MDVFKNGSCFQGCHRKYFVKKASKPVHINQCISGAQDGVGRGQYISMHSGCVPWFRMVRSTPKSITCRFWSGIVLGQIGALRKRTLKVFKNYLLSCRVQTKKNNKNFIKRICIFLLWILLLLLLLPLSMLLLLLLLLPWLFLLFRFYDYCCYYQCR